MKDKLSIKPKILELNNSNDIYMTLNICILSNDVNYNNAQFLDDFIDGVIENKETYIGIPFVVNREKLENAEYSELSHELKDGQLLTDQIGSFVDFWKEEIDDANCLMGSIRIMKRFPNTCKAIVELYNQGNLETSCEVMINAYKEITDDGIRKVHYNEGKNPLIGSAVVTSPAEYRAKATLLVAEAYAKDVEEGVEIVSKRVEFNNGIAPKNKLETNEISYDDIRDAVYNALNPVNATTNERDYRYWIRELFNGYTIVEDSNENNKYFRVGYRIEGEIAILDSSENWIEVEILYAPKGTSLDSLQNELSELNTQITKLKEEAELQMSKTVEELQAELASKENEIAEFKTKLEGLESKVAELNETIVSQAEVKSSLETQITELNTKIAELEPFKEQVETAQREAQITELSSRYEKLLSEETFKSEEVQSAITELNSAKLNEIVVNEVAKQKVVETEIASKTDDVVVTASKQEDLLPHQDVVSKYGLTI